MSKRTLFLIISLFVITLVLLAIALYQPSSPKITQITTIPKEPVAQTDLSFGNLSINASSSSALNYSLPISISTGKNKVTAVQLEMQYDPEVLMNVTIVPGSFFANPNVILNEINEETGRITYAFGVGLADQGITGKDVIATLSFEAESAVPQPTSILLLPKTLVTAEGTKESVLKQTDIVGQFTVGENNSTPSAQ